jgi:hypothetical protein
MSAFLAYWRLKVSRSIHAFRLEKDGSSKRREIRRQITAEIERPILAANVDFLQTYDAMFRANFVFAIIELGSRRAVHLGVKIIPTGEWTVQRVREVT